MSMELGMPEGKGLQRPPKAAPSFCPGHDSAQRTKIAFPEAQHELVAE